MVSYVLVRQYREGRQKEHETAHLIKEDENKTVCGQFTATESRAVRNIGTLMESAMLCSECSDVADDIG